MSSTSARWDKIDQRQDPVISCQSLASVQWPLVTIRVLCTACASMSKCTCLLLTLNPHGELAGSSQHLMSIHVYLIFLPRRGANAARQHDMSERGEIFQNWHKKIEIEQHDVAVHFCVSSFSAITKKKLHPWPTRVWKEKRCRLSKNERSKRTQTT